MYSFDFVYKEQSSVCCVQIDIMVIKFDILLVFDFVPDILQSCSFDFRKKCKTVVKASARVDKFSKSDIIVSPSILSANFAKLGEQVLFLFFNFLVKFSFSVTTL